MKSRIVNLATGEEFFFDSWSEAEAALPAMATEGDWRVTGADVRHPCENPAFASKTRLNAFEDINKEPEESPAIENSSQYRILIRDSNGFTLQASLIEKIEKRKDGSGFTFFARPLSCTDYMTIDSVVLLDGSQIVMEQRDKITVRPGNTLTAFASLGIYGFTFTDPKQLTDFYIKHRNKEP